MQTKHVRVVRAFFYNGKPTVVDSVVELPSVFAAEMVAAKKAEWSDPPEKSQKERSDPPDTSKNEPPKDDSEKTGRFKFKGG